jgi:predicted N-acetyltransferase YhbS
MTIDFIDDRASVDWRELEALYRAAPLGNKNADDLKLVFGNSMFCCFARDHGRLIGAGRVLADGRDCAYLCDVAVRPDYQGTGVGKQIVERLLDKSRDHNKIILYSVAGREPFYARFGFLRMKTAMAMFRNRQSAIDKGLLAEK